MSRRHVFILSDSTGITAEYRHERIPFINTTAKSVEEISTTIVYRVNLERDLM